MSLMWLTSGLCVLVWKMIGNIQCSKTYHVLAERLGSKLRVCQKAGCYVEQLESCFDAGPFAQLLFVVRLFQCNCVPEASNLRLLCSSVSVKKKQRDCSAGVNLTTPCRKLNDSDTMFERLLEPSCNPLRTGGKSTEQKQHDVLGGY